MPIKTHKKITVRLVSGSTGLHGYYIIHDWQQNGYTQPARLSAACNSPASTCRVFVVPSAVSSLGCVRGGPQVCHTPSANYLGFGLISTPYGSGPAPRNQSSMFATASVTGHIWHQCPCLSNRSVNARGVQIWHQFLFCHDQAPVSQFVVYTGSTVHCTWAGLQTTLRVVHTGAPRRPTQCKDSQVHAAHYQACNLAPRWLRAL